MFSWSIYFFLEVVYYSISFIVAQVFLLFWNLFLVAVSPEWVLCREDRVEGRWLNLSHWFLLKGFAASTVSVG